LVNVGAPLTVSLVVLGISCASEEIAAAARIIPNLTLRMSIFCLLNRPGIDCFGKCAVHDESQRCVSDEVERVARDERNRWSLPGFQNPNIVGVNDFDLVDSITGDSRCRIQVDGISDRDVFESAKKTVAMASNPDVSEFSRFGRSADPSCASL